MHEAALEHELDLVEVERFYEIFDGARFHRVNRRAHFLERRNDDDVHVRYSLLQQP